MKILFLSDDFPPTSFGGAGISTCDIALGMKKAGHEVFVVTTCRKEIDSGESDYEGIKVYRIASDYPGRWRSWISLYNRPVVSRVEELIRQLKPDVVHANNIHFYLSYACLKVAKKNCKAVVFTARDVMTFNFSKLTTKRYLENFDYHTTWRDHIKQAGKRWNPLRNIIIKRYLGYADKILAVSDALRKALEQNRIRNVEVMHSGIDVDSWRVSNEDGINFRQKYGTDNKKVILFGGRLSDAKGCKQVLGAMVEILKNIPNAVLLIVASLDGHTNQLTAEANKLEIGDRLLFTGWVGRDKIKFTYACADIVLVTSICFDSFPRIVLEAMASGKPVVGTCYGGASEAIIDGVTGYVVNPFDVDIMSKQIVDLLSNHHKAAEFGHAGRQRIQADFNLDIKVSELISDYKKILSSK
ncbi:MAG: glycosyltransferase family 4 protein [Candidatus Vogelbacteria bacterium]|nr:glycosyltransferase family 4 protein [Candidatus Vogelbacteria bacterium]